MKFKSLGLLALLIPLLAFAALVSAQGATQQSATSHQQYAHYRNDQWHFSLDIPDDWSAQAFDQRGGVTIQFVGPAGSDQFQVSAWPYSDLDIALGEEAPAGRASDQPDTLNIVHAFHNDLFELTFVKNGISYVVQTLPKNATSTLDILKSWQFI